MTAISRSLLLCVTIDNSGCTQTPRNLINLSMTAHVTLVTMAAQAVDQLVAFVISQVLPVSIFTCQLY